MRMFLVALSLLAGAESAWLAAKVRTARAPLSGGNGAAFSYMRPLTVANGSGGALTDYQALLSTDVYPTSYDTADTSLKALWHFSEGTGSTIADSSGTNTTATLVIGATAPQTTSAQAWSNGAAGRVGQGLSFDGADDYATVSTTFTNGYSQITLEAWIYPTGSFYAYEGILTKNTLSGAGTNQVGLELDASGKVWFRADTAGTFKQISSTNSVSLNRWNHVAGVYDGSNLYVYVNGVSDATPVARTGSLLSTGAQFRIGGQHLGTGYSFRGIIDEARVYNRGLSAQEIADHAGLTYGLNSGLVGSWHLNENGGTLAVDSSGNVKHGTLNVASWVSGKYGSAFSGNGTNKRVTIPNDAILNPRSFTVSAWVKTGDATTNFMGVFDKGWCANGGYLMDVVTGGLPRISTLSAGGTYFQAQGTTIADNAWHHIAGTFDASAGTLRLYQDGVLKQTTSSVSLATCTQDLILGGDGVSTNYMNGAIDEVRLYSRALSLSEIQELASSTPKIRPDLQDLRFSTTPDGAGELPYWLESDKAARVKVAGLPAGSSTLYMFYGNPAASFATAAQCSAPPSPGSGYANCGRNVFDFFDDFSDGTMSWVVAGAAGWTESGGVLSGSAGAEKTRVKAAFADSGDTIYEYKLRQSGTSSYPWAGLQVKGPDTEYTAYDQGYLTLVYGPATNLLRVFRATGGTIVQIGTDAAYAVAANQWYQHRFSVAGGQLRWLINGSQVQSVSDATYTTGQVIRLWVTDAPTQTADFDDVRVRKYAAVEPTSWAGAEAAAGY